MGHFSPSSISISILSASSYNRTRDEWRRWTIKKKRGRNKYERVAEGDRGPTRPVRERERERIVMHASAAAKTDNWRPSQRLMYKNNNSVFRRAIIILHMSLHMGTVHCKLSVPMDLSLSRNYFMRTKQVESMNRTDGRHFSCSPIRKKKPINVIQVQSIKHLSAKIKSLVWIY